jgi:hypothetical protein
MLAGASTRSSEGEARNSGVTRSEEYPAQVVTVTISPSVVGSSTRIFPPWALFTQ